MEKEAQPLEFFFLAMAHWQRGEKDEAVHFFQQGVAGATKDPTNPEQRISHPKLLFHFRY
jgi:hypothetical protein